MVAWEFSTPSRARSFRGFLLLQLLPLPMPDDDRLFVTGADAPPDDRKIILGREAQRVVAATIDFAKTSGIVSVPKRYRGALATQVVRLLEEGIDPLVVEAAARHLILRGIDPSLLASCVVTVQAEAAGAGVRMVRDSDRRLLDDFLARHDHNWPTGWRMVRGTHGHSFVRDPLGYDTHTGGGRPRRQEVLDALKEKNAHARTAGAGD